jgi:hypothetical protein
MSLGINEGEAAISKVMIIGTRNIYNGAIRTTKEEEEEKETMATNNRKGKNGKEKKSYLGRVMTEGEKKSKWRGQKNVE